jgi:hypothetical protein
LGFNPLLIASFTSNYLSQCRAVTTLAQGERSISGFKNGSGEKEWIDLLNTPYLSYQKSLSIKINISYLTIIASDVL